MIQPPRVAARETVSSLSGQTTTIASAASWNQIDDLLGEDAVKPNQVAAKQVAETTRNHRWKGEPPSSVDAMECGRPYTDSEMAIPRRDSWVPFRVRRRRRRIMMTIAGTLAVGSVAYIGWLSSQDSARTRKPTANPPSVSRDAGSMPSSIMNSTNPVVSETNLPTAESGKVTFASHATEKTPRKAPTKVIPAEHSLPRNETSPSNSAAPVDSTQKAPRKVVDQFGNLFGENGNAIKKKRPTNRQVTVRRRPS